MTNEKIMDKVKKLMALSKSPVEAEAKLALMKAQEMLKKYNLSIKDIHKEEVVEKEYHFNRKSPVKWQMSLILRTMRGFNCEVIQSTEWDEKNGGRKIVYTFIGSEADLEVGEYVLEYLLSTIKSLCKKYMATLTKTDAYAYGMSEWSYMDTRRTSYCNGLATEFGHKVKEFQSNQEHDDQKYSGGLTGTEMVHIKRNSIEKYMAGAYGNLKSSKSRRGGKQFGDSVAQGRNDGKNVSIHRGVSGGARQRMLT